VSIMVGWTNRSELRSFSRPCPISGVRGEIYLYRSERAAAGEETMNRARGLPDDN
jgi:hypothetical protein